MTDLTTVTATELSALYRSGTVSPVTVAEQVLTKIAQINPVLNAFCFTDPDATLKQAQASEQRWRQEQPLSAMDGVPVAIKDSILTQGWPTLHASLTVDPDQHWTEDAPAVARLREAGAVLVGKTTMSEFGSSEHHSNSLLYGNVHNPWNALARSGGSSGGSAVAVAAGLVPVALGSDLGGSVAVPSAYCGVFGLKTSTGRIPQWPVDAMELSTVCPMARCSADIAMTMNIITKSDVRDGTALPYHNVNYCDTLTVSLAGKKIACVKSVTGFDIDSYMAESMQKAVDYLLSQGAQIEFINLDTASALSVFYELISPRMWQQWNNISESKRHLAGKDLQRRAILAHRPDHTHDQLTKRQQLISHTRMVMQSYDALLGPATVIDSLEPLDPTQNISPLSMFFCVTKQPGITVPIGLNAKGLPQSVTIAGRMHDDVSVLSLAQAIESAFPMPTCPVIL